MVWTKELHLQPDEVPKLICKWCIGSDAEIVLQILAQFLNSLPVSTPRNARILRGGMALVLVRCVMSTWELATKFIITYSRGELYLTWRVTRTGNSTHQRKYSRMTYGHIMTSAQD